MNNKEITGTLEHWWYDSSYDVYWGYIYDDIRRRFDDGIYIHTSKVLSIDDDIVTTRNSVYKLGEELK